MKEVDLQKLVIDVVREAGGAAHKLSNRFLIGVADLLVKLPLFGPVLIEVKLQKIGQTTPNDFQFALGLTVLQRQFLQDYYDAGMWCGVLSFVERGGKGIRGMSMRLFDLDLVMRRGYRVRADEHVDIGAPQERNAAMLQLLKDGIQE